MKLSVINKGFSLVEVVVALFILSVSVITIYNLILSTAVSSYDLEQRYLAKEVANNRISLINTIEKVLKEKQTKYVFSICRNKNLKKYFKELGYHVDDKPSYEIIKTI